MSKKKLLYADGLTLDEFNKDFGIEIDGYTFNPSLFKKHGAKDYLDYSKKILSLSNSKPVSLEVFADSEAEIITQARKLSSLSSNVYVKVPITFTNQDFTTEVIKKLIELKIKLNITAIFTLQQVEEILPIINDTETIISVFAGRIYDCGLDASKIMEDISKKLKKIKVNVNYCGRVRECLMIF